MKKLLTLALLAVLFFIPSFAQKVSGSVKGVLQDRATQQPLPDATVSAMGLKDSSFKTFTLSSNNGSFEIKNLDTGSYYLLITFQGFEMLKKVFSISEENIIVDLQTIKMQRSYKVMQEIVVKDEAPIRVKGDTLSFNANSFKTKPNATVEDLLKKLPGVQVERDGTVKTQGENVQKVYVDGKEFFSNDPKLATKNITADMIDAVEVYDDMSEQAKFNRIDDGSRSKAINLKLKKDKKKGMVGKVYAGYGTENLYDAGITSNFFKSATQLSIIAKTNITSNASLNSSNMMGLSSSGSGMGSFSSRSIGGGSMEGNSGFNSGSGGITKSTSVGLNYRDVWSNHFDVNGSYFYSRTDMENRVKGYRQNFFSDSAINSEQHSFSQNSNNNHRINFRLIYTIDSLNSIIYLPTINIQNSQRISDDTSNLFAEKNNSRYKLNDTRNLNNNTSQGVNWTNSLIWRRKFSRAGRTLSVYFSNTYGRNKREGTTRSVSKGYSESGAKIRDNSFNQQNFTESNTDNYSVSISYTEPIAKDKILELNYGYSNNQSGSDRHSYDYNNSSGEYDIENNQFANHFQNKNESNRLGTNLRIVKKKYNYQIGIGAQRMLQESNDLLKEKRLSQYYINLFPSASFNYQFARRKSLRFNYRGRTNQPGILQLQNILDVSRVPYYFIGNPGLQQEFINNVSVTYNFFNTNNYRNFFATINFSNTYNKIVDSILQNGFEQQFGIPEGGGNQLIIPANMNGLYNVNGSVNFGFPIRQMKGGNFNTTTGILFNRNGNYSNGIKNFSRNMTLAEELRLSYNYKEKLDISLSAGISYTSAQYTIQKNRSTFYYTHTYTADLTYIFPHDFIFSTDFDFMANAGRRDGFNQNFLIWNASFIKQLLKNKRGEIKASIFDILNNNQSLIRNVGDNYIEDIQSNILRRYFILSFTYKFNRNG